MGLSMGNTLTSFEARRTFTIKKSDAFTLDAGTDKPLGEPDTKIAEADWTAGTGATLNYNSGFASIASDGTGGRYASLPISVTPNTTYSVATKITATTNLSGGTEAGSDSSFLIGTAINNGAYVNESSHTATIAEDFTVGNAVSTIYVTIKSDDASRIGWFDYMHIWEKGFTDSNIVANIIV